ncbi:DoxX family protein [Candidatus Leptofilum sp.]|uniref:DoxX family protein n=1 Tax=Candidatus Leptofilum sp. TaxID=3241576 RepID=UPI003B5B9EEC
MRLIALEYGDNVAARDKIIYWITTGLLSASMIMSALTYVLQNEMMGENFMRLGHPAYLVYPLALAKTLGIIAILTKRSPLLKEWAYAGFFFDFVLALMAHIALGDVQFVLPVITIILLLVSRFYDPKVFGTA